MTSGELRVRLFAGLREEAGWQERSLVHQSGMTAAAVWKLLNLGGPTPPATVRVAINHEFAALDMLVNISHGAHPCESFSVSNTRQRFCIY